MRPSSFAPNAATLAIALAVAIAAGPAHAILNGINPDAGPVTNPVTQLESILSRLGGSVAGVSAVQVAPRWILASRHATPPVGSAFANKYGASTVSSCVFPTTTYTAVGPNDISLCRLNTAIALPAGASFPAVTGLPATGGNVSHWGYVEAVGFSGGLRRVAWSGFDGLPPNYNIYDIGLNPTGPYVAVGTTLPYTAGGDSGGGVFFYPYDGTAGYLAGVLTGEAPVGVSPTYLSASHAQWVRTTILSQGDAAPAYVDFGQLVGDTTSRLARSMAGTSVTAQVTGATSATLNWTAPTGTGNDNAPVTRYLLSVGSPDTPSGIVKLGSLSGTSSLNALADGKRYQACVLSGNALGYRQSFGLVKDLTTGVRQLQRYGCTWFTAGTPGLPVTQDWQLALNAAGKVDLSVVWAPPLPNGVTTSSYVVTVKVWANWGDYGKKPAIRTVTLQTSALNGKLTNLISGKEAACWSMAARSATQVVGASTENLCFTVNSVF